MNEAPSVEIAKSLQAAYDYFSRRLFEPVFGQPMPEVILNLSRKRGAMAFFATKEWKDAQTGKAMSEISLVPEYTGRNPKLVMSSLVHEMAHFLDHLNGTACKNGYHGKAWAGIMARLGLPEDPQKTRSGKVSRLKVSHIIEAGGPFDNAYKKMPDFIRLPFVTRYGKTTKVAADGAPTMQGKRARYQCPGCACEYGNKAPVFRGPSGRVIRCADHDEEFVETGI